MNRGKGTYGHTLGRPSKKAKNTYVSKKKKKKNK